MKKLLPLLLLLIATHWAQGQVQASDTIFVNGDPTRVVDNTQERGTRANPWKTIAQAVADANANRPADGVATIAILSFPGTADTPPVYQLTGSIPIMRSVELTTDDAEAGLVVLQGSALVDEPMFRIDTPDTVRIRNLVLEGNASNVGVAITDATNLTVSNNLFRSFATGISIRNTVQNVFVTENVFDDNIVGLSVASGGEADSDLADVGLTVVSNRFIATEGNIAIDNQSGKVINAEYNWWGNSAADLVASAVTENVDYSPWLSTGNDEALFGFQGDFSAITLGGGPLYDSTRNELQAAFDQPNTQELSLVGNVSYDSLEAIKRTTLLIEKSDADTISIDDIVVNIPNDTLPINGSLFVAKSISLVNGSIKTIGDSSEVTLGNNVKPISESEGRLVGRFTVVSRAVGTENFGILGLNISKGSSDIGEVTLTRITGPQGIVNQNGNESIAATWIINSTRPPGSDTPRTLNFFWHSSFDNIDIGSEPGFADTTAVVWRSSDDGQTWEAQSGELETDVGGNSFPDLRRATAMGVTEFSAWTVSIVNKPLPVILTDFTAQLNASSVRLDWSTSSEINSDYFAVERSTDGYVYEPLARSKAAGDTQTEQHYLYIDEGVTNRLAGIVYYRLHMVDFDGSSEYSPVVAVSLEGEQPLLVYANRNDGTFKLFGSLPEAAYTVQVSDLLGNIVYEAYLPTQPGVREYTLPVPTLAQSVYTLRCRGDQDVFVRKFRVE